MRPPVELGVHRAPRCEPVVSLVRSRRAPPVPLIVLPKSCSCRCGPCPPPLSLVWVVSFLSFFLLAPRGGMKVAARIGEGLRSFISFFGVPAALMGVVPPTACEPPRCRGAPRGQALDQGSEREHWGVPLAWGAEDTCHSFRETGPWILLTVTSAGCPSVQLGVPLATSDVCRAKPGGCEACSRGLG